MKRLKHQALCKLVKADAKVEAEEAFKKLVDHPSYLCTLCGRACNDGHRLCAPCALRSQEQP